MLKADKKQGFTIVELLIVVVVIAILAAISIVAYNGITNRAKESAAQSEAAQAAKKIAADMITNSEQAPADITSLGLRDSDTTSYQYSRNTSATPQTFCVTVTKSNVSYFATSSNSTPQKGACPGHGKDGVSPITNLVLNPQGSTYSVTNGFRIATGRWYGGSGAGNYGLETGTTPVGNTFARKTWTVTPTGNNGDSGYNGGMGTVATGDTYTFSAYIRASKPKWQQFGVSLYEPGNETAIRRESAPSSQLLSANVWTRVSWTFTVPAGVDRIAVLIDIIGSTASGAQNWAAGDTLDLTGYMVTKGSTLYNFADGETTNWVWSGARDQSTSQGPPSV